MTPWDETQALEIIHRLLPQKGWTVATAESLTAGLIAATLASQSGSSAYLRGGIVAYTLDAKVHLLGVDREVADKCNCVSNVVAMQMAMGVKDRLHTDCGIAVTGYSESPTQGETPFAHYVVFCGPASSTGLVHGKGLSRNEMRQEVVRHTLCELAMMLEAAHEEP